MVFGRRSACVTFSERIRALRISNPRHSPATAGPARATRRVSSCSHRANNRFPRDHRVSCQVCRDKYRSQPAPGKISSRRRGPRKVLQAFQAAPLADLGFAQVDTHCAQRKGFPEVIFGAGKTPEQVLKIAAKFLDHDQHVLVTRLTPEHARMCEKNSSAPSPRTRPLHDDRKRAVGKRAGNIAVVCAGTSDLPVAEEAAVTAEIMGNTVERVPMSASPACIGCLTDWK